MVTEAWSKINQTVKQTMKYIGHLAVVTRANISFSEDNNIAATSQQVKKCLLEIVIGNSNFNVDITFIFSNCAQKQTVTRNN